VNRAVGAGEMDGQVCKGNRRASWARADQWSEREKRSDSCRTAREAV